MKMNVAHGGRQKLEERTRAKESGSKLQQNTQRETGWLR